MITDITFNGQSASDFGLLCLQEGDSEDLNDQVGGTYEIKKDVIPSKKTFQLYESNITEPTTFNLIFMHCNCDSEYIELDEQYAIMDWLIFENEYKWLQINTEGYENILFRAKFYNPQIKTIGSKVFAMTFTCMLDGGHAYSEEIIKKHNVTPDNNTFTICNNSSFKSMYIYPTVQIVVGENTDTIEIENLSEPNSDRHKFIINNLQEGDHIFVDGENKIMYKEASNDSLLQDFNKQWLRLKQGNNIIKITGNVTITITYHEKRMVGIY